MSEAFDLNIEREPAWSEKLRPHGEGSFEKEDFATWWNRNEQQLSHLPPDLCEQWVFRHWHYSPFAFLPLESLSYERKVWDGVTLLGSVYRAWGGKLDAQFDYETFQRGGGEDRQQTAKAIDSGTWDYPMVLLATPHGIKEGGEYLSPVHHVIVEGHQRHRYMNALHARGIPPSGPHETIVITSPLVEAG